MNVPLVLSLATVKLALLPAGSPDLSAVSEAIGSPSGSEAFTLRVSEAFSSTLAAAGALTTGARSGPPLTTTVARAVPVNPELSVTVSRAFQVPVA